MTESEFRSKVGEIARAHQSAREAGGPWQVWFPLPSSRAMHLHWSFATLEEAQARIASWRPSLQAVATIRHKA